MTTEHAGTTQDAGDFERGVQAWLLNHARLQRELGMLGAAIESESVIASLTGTPGAELSRPAEPQPLAG